jgi:CBS domain-containing protein
MKVKDILIKDVISIDPDDNAKSALAILFKRQISGLPVIDKGGRLVGMFTEKEVMSYLLPSYIEKVGRFIYQEDPKATKRKFSELEHIKVSQIMRKEVVTVMEDTSLAEVARMMLTQKARRIPVLDAAGKVVGIIARPDVLKAFAQAADIAL